MSRSESFSVGASPDPLVERASNQFIRQSGLSVPTRNFSNVTITRPASSVIGNTYDAAPDFDPKAVPAYKAMMEETGRQYDLMTKPRSKGGLGLDV